MIITSITKKKDQTIASLLCGLKKLLRKGGTEQRNVDIDAKEIFTVHGVVECSAPMGYRTFLYILKFCVFIFASSKYFLISIN